MTSMSDRKLKWKRASEYLIKSNRGGYSIGVWGKGDNKRYHAMVDAPVGWQKDLKAHYKRGEVVPKPWLGLGFHADRHLAMAACQRHYDGLQAVCLPDAGSAKAMPQPIADSGAVDAVNDFDVLVGC